MRRFLAALTLASLALSLVPGVASAARVIKFHEDSVFAGCGGEFDGGFANAFAEQSVDFGEFAGVEIYDGEGFIPVLSGFTDSVEVERGPEVVISATIPIFDPEGNAAGDAELAMTLAPDGEPFIDMGFDDGNFNSHTMVIRQPLIGTGTITLPDDSEITLDCFGESAEGDVFQTNPNAFTARREGVAFECIWETEGAFYFVFGNVDSAFGESIDAGWFSETEDVFTFEQFSGTLDESGVDASLQLVDFFTGDEHTATVEASFTATGEVVRSVIVESDVRERLVQHLLSVDGTFETSTGVTLVMDDEACGANAYTSRLTITSAQGPRHGKAPSNDAPAGAIELEAGSKLNVQTIGTAPDAEAPNELCDEGPVDQMGHTVWYTLVGDGEEVTFDTAGSNFDTIVAVYVMEGDELVEIACVDDVFGESLGISLQASITGVAEEGVTYWIQVGGWGVEFFGEGQAGRLRVRVS